MQAYPHIRSYTIKKDFAICRCLPAPNVLAGANNPGNDNPPALGVMPPVSQLSNVPLAREGDKDPLQRSQRLGKIYRVGGIY